MSGDEQLELELAADYGWFHVLKGRLMKGLLRELDATPWAVYTVLKCHANHENGVANVSQERLGWLVNRRPEAVAEAIKKLIEHGLVQRTKRGRHWEYRIMETATVKHRPTGLERGVADFPYIPAQFKQQLDSIKAFLENGIPPRKGLSITLNVNLIQQGDHGTVNLQQISLDHSATSAEVMQALKALKKIDD